MNEIIICAAVRSNGKVWHGHRHGHALAAMQDELSYDMSRKQMLGLHPEQGFVTGSGKFVGREEAYRIAFDADQLLVREPETIGTLYSEDLY